jgi:predicted ATPase
VRLGVSRASIGRWESGRTPPDAFAETALIEFCREAGLFRRYTVGVLAGRDVTEDWLSELLSDARLGKSTVGRLERPGSRTGPGEAVTRDQSGSAPKSSFASKSVRLRSSVPIPPTRTVGRSHEIDAVVTQLRRDDVRLVTIVGTGGCGKTRLAMEAAHHLALDFEDGAHFIDLSPIREPMLVASTLAHALGVGERGGEPVMTTLRNFLRGKALLLVLDNCEQIQDGATLVAELCTIDWGVKILATSRSPIHISAEQLVEIQPLPVPGREPSPSAEDLAEVPSVALFVERARAIQRTFAIDSTNSDAIVTICRQSDGLPLALELAASLIRTLTVNDIARRLARPLEALTVSPHDLPDRHSTLRGAFAWSYDLLSQLQQAVFRRLSVFAGRWTTEAAGQVLDLDDLHADDMLTVLQALLDAGLIQRTEVSDAVSWSMLNTVREFAAELLSTADDYFQLRTRHLIHYARLSRVAYSGITGSSQQAHWLSRLDDDIDNIRSALSFGLSEPDALPFGLNLVAALTPYWWRGRIREGREWIEQYLTRSQGSGSRQRMAALGAASTIMLHVGGFRKAVPYIHENILLSRSLGVGESLATALGMRAMAHAAQGEDSLAIQSAREAEAVAGALGKESVVAQALTWCGITYVYLGHLEAAEQTAGTMLHAAERSGDAVGLAGALCRYAEIALLRGDYPQAERRCADSLRVLAESRSDTGAVAVLARQGRVFLAQGNLREAQMSLCAGLREAYESASLYASLGILSGVAQLWMADRKDELATQLYGYLEVLGNETGIPSGSIFRGEEAGRLSALEARLHRSDFTRHLQLGLSASYESIVALAIKELSGER